jgi:hypothetical protein
MLRDAKGRSFQRISSHGLAKVPTAAQREASAAKLRQDRAATVWWIAWIRRNLEPKRTPPIMKTRPSKHSSIVPPLPLRGLDFGMRTTDPSCQTRRIGSPRTDMPRKKRARDRINEASWPDTGKGGEADRPDGKGKRPETLLEGGDAAPGCEGHGVYPSLRHAERGPPTLNSAFKEIEASSYEDFWAEEKRKAAIRAAAIVRRPRLFVHCARGGHGRASGRRGDGWNE